MFINKGNFPVLLNSEIDQISKHLIDKKKILLVKFIPIFIEKTCTHIFKDHILSFIYQVSSEVKVNNLKGKLRRKSQKKTVAMVESSHCHRLSFLE